MKYYLAFLLFLCVSAVAQNDTRDHSITFSVTSAEAKALMGAAEEAHLDLGDFVRAKVMQGIKPDTQKQADSAKPKPPAKSKLVLPEWKIWSGTWAQKGGVVSGRAGIIEWTGKAKDTLDISFSVKIDKWDGQGAIAVIWNAGHRDKLRNLAVFKQDTICVTTQPKRPDFQTQTIELGIPDGKIVHIKATLTRAGIVVKVGRKQIGVKVPAEQVGKLQLYANGPNASFSNIEVRTTMVK